MSRFFTKKKEQSSPLKLSVWLQMFLFLVFQYLEILVPQILNRPSDNSWNGGEKQMHRGRFYCWCFLELVCPLFSQITLFCSRLSQPKMLCLHHDEMGEVAITEFHRLLRLINCSPLLDCICIRTGPVYLTDWDYRSDSGRVWTYRPSAVVIHQTHIGSSQ